MSAHELILAAAAGRGLAWRSAPCSGRWPSAARRRPRRRAGRAARRRRGRAPRPPRPRPRPSIPPCWPSRTASAAAGLGRGEPGASAPRRWALAERRSAGRGQRPDARRSRPRAAPARPVRARRGLRLRGRRAPARRGRGRGPRGRRAGLAAALGGAAARTPACRPRRASPPSSTPAPTRPGSPRPTARRSGSTRAWLEAVDAASLDEAAAPRRWPSTAAPTRWPARPPTSASGARPCAGPPSAGRRRAFRVTAQPLEGGGVGVWTEDVTEPEELREALQAQRRGARRDPEPHRRRGGDLRPAKRLIFHNTAFAELWGLEPAWLAEQPTHGEVLDRLRQRRRLPETVDYAKWKAAELGRYEQLAAGARRPLEPAGRPHPEGGAPAAPAWAACCCCSPTSPTS